MKGFLYNVSLDMYLKKWKSNAPFVSRSSIVYLSLVINCLMTVVRSKESIVGASWFKFFPMSGSAYIAGVGITKLESASRSTRDYPDLGAEAARVSPLLLSQTLCKHASSFLPHSIHSYMRIPEMLRRCR